MPWSRLRVHRPSDPGDAPFRHNAVDPSLLDRHSEQVLRRNYDASQPNFKRLDEQLPDVADPIEQITATEQTLISSRSHSPDRQDSHLRPQRFSMLKFRHASDSQLSRTAKNQAMAPISPIPSAPSIITTAPTIEYLVPAQKRKSTFTLPRRYKPADQSKNLSLKPSQRSLAGKTSNSNSGQGSSLASSANQSARVSRITFEEPERLRSAVLPPAYGDETHSSLALPISRLSESSRSDGSSGDHGVYATTTTTHTVSTTTTFFRLPRRKKNKGPLFPLPNKIPPQDQFSRTSITPRDSTSGRPSESPSRNPPIATIYRPFHAGRGDNGLPSPVPSSSQTALAASSTIFAAPGVPASRRDSMVSVHSSRSSPALAPPPRLGARGRSSTKGSLGQLADGDSPPTPPLPQSGRNSTSTTGRASLGGLFGFSRFRNNSEALSTRNGTAHTSVPSTPGSNGSKAHSFSINREPVIVVPERQEGDTPAKYLMRLEEAVSRGVVATILSKSDDEFSKNVLRSYMRGFNFFGYPLDMSIRKLLMEVELPKETQQIDRVLQAFANRYHECNPGVYDSPDEAYFIAFSILILHTDVFNKNNKHKMQKFDYIKNAKGQGVADEILECFYDNISYTPFIHVEDDVDINGERIITHKSRKSIFTIASTESLKRPTREPVDPYTLILDNALDSLRPSLKDVMNLDDPYNYLGSSNSLDLANLHRTFFKSGILQILSSRSRPEAFMSPETMANPAEAHPGVVDIKITKVGILWRKDMKKKKARSPWQEWGAILTGSQLYFFRNTTWIRSLIYQHDAHHRHGLAGSPVTFKPPLEQFKPDVMMSTEDAVALLDTSYKKHKNAFIFVRHGGFEETFIADNDGDMNDWLAKLNYASAFRSAGVRMRGLVGGSSDGHKSRGMRRMDSGNSAQSVPSSTGEVRTRNGKLDTELARQVQVARRQIMVQKIAEAEEKLDIANRQLEGHLRNARHLQILAPIQNKTREQLLLAAGGMAAKIKWQRMEMWRTRCHKEILAMDLDEEIKSSKDRNPRNENLSNIASSSDMISAQDPTRQNSQQGYVRENQQTPRRGSATRPSTQPSPARAFNMDDVFQSSLQNPFPGHQHKSQGSWELPPLSFNPTGSSLKSRSSLGVTASTSQPLTPLSYHSSPASIKTSERIPDIVDMATRLATPTSSLDDEQEILKEAGLVGPDSPSPKTKAPELVSDGEKDRDLEKARSPEGDVNDGRNKVRRSLHRTLRDTHVPSHHRGRKGKDSASSTGMTEDASSLAESEGLARSAGSFTVHGKKASVITFGSEWQDMSPEERMKLPKSIQAETSKLSVPSAIEDEGITARSTYQFNGRPLSGISFSTTTTKSTHIAQDEEREADSVVGDGAELRDTVSQKDINEPTPGGSSRS